MNISGPSYHIKKYTERYSVIDDIALHILYRKRGKPGLRFFFNRDPRVNPLWAAMVTDIFDFHYQYEHVCRTIEKLFEINFLLNKLKTLKNSIPS